MEIRLSVESSRCRRAAHSSLGESTTASTHQTLLSPFDLLILHILIPMNLENFFINTLEIRYIHEFATIPLQFEKRRTFHVSLSKRSLHKILVR